MGEEFKHVQMRRIMHTGGKSKQRAMHGKSKQRAMQ